MLTRHPGLPDADRLRQILSRHEVSHRRPSLLHSDLDPWNPVRRDDAFALTFIHREAALVGDPLHGLVRHMHLTPTHPEVRERVFRRWGRGLPSECTRDGRKGRQVHRRLELVRSARVDLDRIVTGPSLDVPDVRRALVQSGAVRCGAVRPGPGAGAEADCQWWVRR
ncbi:hypothetical protein ABZ892_26145 [Streptomyces sp. NPDC046924]|uniref:hypothetical protein n=1 Tax=Streptomyces sp. NPDC046924 TaxID=3155136 RepID=UPI0034006E20